MNSLRSLGTAVAVVAWMATGAHGLRLCAGLVVAIVLPLAIWSWPQRLHAARSAHSPNGVGRWAARVAVEFVTILTGTALFTPWGGPPWDVDPGRVFLAFVALGAGAYATFRIEVRQNRGLTDECKRSTWTW